MGARVLARALVLYPLALLSGLPDQSGCRCPFVMLVVGSAQSWLPTKSIKRPILMIAELVDPARAGSRKSLGDMAHFWRPISAGQVLMTSNELTLASSR